MVKTTRYWLALAALCGLLGVAHATPPATTPVKIIVGYPPGNLTDSVARMVAKRLGEKWQRPFIVENRPGAGSSLAPRAVAAAPNDGSVLLVTGQAAIITNPHMYADIGYKSFEDFEFVNNLIWTPYVCSVSKDLNISSMKELIQYTKANPGKVTFGSAGVGTTSHLIMEAMRGQLGLNVAHVPYKGSSGVMNDLVAGHIQMGCEPPPASTPFVLDKRITAVGVTGKRRLPSLPNVPTIEEQSFDFVMGAWVGMLSPKGTPKEYVERLSRDVDAVMHEPEIQAALAKHGVDITTPGPVAFRALAIKDSETYGAIIKRLGIKVN